ncbi:MAG: IS5/IS1182 family transposase, partial [Micrococcaceae bacterium]|nr:IS5/IS1182 family transposase [Micrococcaceae bacterium]NWN89369.1 IS5/IS1182 family transposase [Micrococcaceae bacterium]
RTNSWHSRGFGILQVVLDRTQPPQQAWASMANAIIVLRRLLHEARLRYRWDTRTVKPYDFR